MYPTASTTYAPEEKLNQPENVRTPRPPTTIKHTPRLNSNTSQDQFRIGGYANNYYSTHPSASASTLDSDMVYDDESGRELPVMWGRIPGSSTTVGSPREFSVITSTLRDRARSMTSRPSTRIPFRQFEEQLDGLPILNQAVAATEHTKQQRPVTSYSTTHPKRFTRRSFESPSAYVTLASSSPFTPHPTQFSSNSQSFSRSLLNKHCGSYMVSSLDEAHNVIGALRLELDLLKRINDTLSNPGRGTGVDGSTNVHGPYSFSEENFQILYLENEKLRGILNENIERYDETTLALQQKQRECNIDRDTLKKKEDELVTLRMKQASSEQEVVNLKYSQTQLERKLSTSETLTAKMSQELKETTTNYQTLKSEHVLCTAFKSLVQTEREEYYRETESLRKEVMAITAEKEKSSAALGTMEGRLVVQYETVRNLKQDLEKMKADKATTLEKQNSLSDELSASRVELVQAQGELTRLQHEFTAKESEAHRLRDELQRCYQTLSHNSNESTQVSATFDAYRAEMEKKLAELRAQLKAAEENNVKDTTNFLNTIESLQAQLSALSNDFNAMKEDQAKAKLSNSALQQKNQELTDSYEQLSQTLRSVRTDLQQSSEAEESLRQEVEELRRLTGIKRPKSTSSEDLALRKKKSTDTTSSSKPGTPSTSDTNLKADIFDLDHVRELELSLKESQQAYESLRRQHEKCSGRISKAEHELDRELSLRRIQLKSAKEIRRRLESHVGVLEVRCVAMAKALTQLGEKGRKAMEKFGGTPHIDEDGKVTSRPNTASSTQSRTSPAPPSR